MKTFEAGELLASLVGLGLSGDDLLMLFRQLDAESGAEGEKGQRAGAALELIGAMGWAMDEVGAEGPPEPLTEDELEALKAGATPRLLDRVLLGLEAAGGDLFATPIIGGGLIIHTASYLPVAVVFDIGAETNLVYHQAPLVDEDGGEHMTPEEVLERLGAIEGERHKGHRFEWTLNHSTEAVVVLQVNLPTGAKGGCIKIVEDRGRLAVVSSLGSRLGFRIVGPRHVYVDVSNTRE